MLVSIAIVICLINNEIHLISIEQDAMIIGNIRSYDWIFKLSGWSIFVDKLTTSSLLFGWDLGLFNCFIYGSLTEIIIYLWLWYWYLIIAHFHNFLWMFSNGGICQYNLFLPKSTIFTFYQIFYTFTQDLAVYIGLFAAEMTHNLTFKVTIYIWCLWGDQHPYLY